MYSWSNDLDFIVYAGSVSTVVLLSATFTHIFLFENQTFEITSFSTTMSKSSKYYWVHVGKSFKVLTWVEYNSESSCEILYLQ